MKKSSSNCFVAMIDLSVKHKFKEDLLDQGFEITQPPYTVFSAKKAGVSCTLYESGKLTVQGKNKEEFITFYLEPEILKDVSYSHADVFIDPTPRIGNDESGKGDFFGPLCIAGVYAAGDSIKDLLKIGVKDSKKLTDHTILDISKQIRSQFPHKILILQPKKYNELYTKFANLNRLLGWCHATFIEHLAKETHCKTVLLDQFAPAPLMHEMLKKKQLSLDLTQRPRAEEDPVVAAASILARASFVESMHHLSQKMNIELPKGASSQVIQIGKQLVRKHGKEVLEELAKLHFKTTEAILND